MGFFIEIPTISLNFPKTSQYYSYAVLPLNQYSFFKLYFELKTSYGFKKILI